MGNEDGDEIWNKLLNKKGRKGMKMIKRKKNTPLINDNDQPDNEKGAS